MECVITFRNIAHVFDSKPSSAQILNSDPTREPPQNTHTVNDGYRRSSNAIYSQGHWNTASLNRGKSRTTAAPGASTPNNSHADQFITNGRHRRSVSIVSIGGDTTIAEDKSQGVSASRRPGHGHGRAISLQMLPGRSNVSAQGLNSGRDPFESSVSVQNNSPASAYDHAATKPATLSSSTFSTLVNAATARKLHMPAASGPVLAGPHDRTPSVGISSPPRIWHIPSSPGITMQQARDKFRNNTHISTDPSESLMQDQPSQVLDTHTHLTKVFSSTSNDGTPRSSTDLYSASNNSSDTLVSEYVNAEFGRATHQSVPGQQRSHPLLPKFRQAPEVLMMGYASVVGGFDLDPSLVNPTSFDEIKGKAVIGSQGGGGVVRAASTQRQSGLLGSFGWKALGESLGGILGGGEMSSIKEATKTNGAKSLPILSTPQSLLFTDLRLEPGQSKSYFLTYQLPPGMPPTYRGKALRVSYNIVVGVQRKSRPNQRHIVRSTNFPFRVLPSVNGMA